MKRLIMGGMVMALISGALMASGCENPFQAPVEPVRPLAVAPVQFKDVPIPYGFEFLPNQSGSHIAPTFRSGVMKYRGDALLSRTKSFFANEMPAAGWDVYSIREPSMGTAVMKFTKGKELCTVTIRAEEKTTELKVEIGPLP